MDSALLLRGVLPWLFGVVAFALLLRAVVRRGLPAPPTSPALHRTNQKLVRLMEHLEVEPERGPSLAPAVVDAWRAGEHERAAQQLARTSGLAMVDARRRLMRLFGGAGRLERNVDLLLAAYGLQVDVDEAAPPGVREAYESGGKIQAIKTYRIATGSGLREAKEAVEELADRLGW